MIIQYIKVPKATLQLQFQARKLVSKVKGNIVVTYGTLATYLCIFCLLCDFVDKLK